jgi:hypothetical protein
MFVPSLYIVKRKKVGDEMVEDVRDLAFRQLPRLSFLFSIGGLLATQVL